MRIFSDNHNDQMRQLKDSKHMIVPFQGLKEAII